MRSVLVSGDNAGSAGVIAAALGITDVRAEVLPADKARIVAELKAGLPVHAFPKEREYFVEMKLTARA